VPGDLLLDGPFMSLDGPHLTSVGGTLTISNTRLKSLAGLEELTSVGSLHILDVSSTDGLSSLRHVGELELTRVQASTLSGFDQLTELPGGLLLQACPMLASLVAFANVRQIGSIQVISNDSLRSLLGLEHLVGTGRLVIDRNNSLGSLAGLDSIQSATSVQISSNLGLTSLHGLESLSNTTSQSIRNQPLIASLSPLSELRNAGDLELANIGKLVSLDGLANVTRVHTLTVSSNPLLSTLAPLTAWPAHVADSLMYFRGNPLLPQCQVDSFCAAQLDAGCSDWCCNLEDAGCD
jgi:hypothetical protein